MSEISVFKMFVFNIVLISFAISPAVGAVVTNLASSTSCRNLTEAAVSHWRSKRQSLCGSYQWRCADGTCIATDEKCDGKFDCPDKSDETHALCRTNKCQRNWFRCTYGACVDGAAPCNGIDECVDQSDELLPRCRNQSLFHNGKFRCFDGNAIYALDACDGTPNCPDGSDETVAACAGRTCPVHLFQCAYGACVDRGSDCNGRKDCADGSDESDELCDNNIMVRAGTGNTPAVINTAATTGGCLLPEHPAHGSYEVINSPTSRPGQSLPSAVLNITCYPGYFVIGGGTVVSCRSDMKFPPIPTCVPHCKLEPHISVQYNCIISYGVGVRPCEEYEPPGTRVTTECKPNYFLNEITHEFMKCNQNGGWNRVVTCQPECGRVTPMSENLIYGGNTAKRGELPWYVAIYKKPTQARQDHELICGGTIVSTRVVISAGHCFWNQDSTHDASLFAVATAKLFKEWDHEEDKDVQKSNIISINLTEHYSGVDANEQDDIAILTLETPFRYYNYVRRVCLDFTTFNDQQLPKGILGKIAGFGLTSADDRMGSPVLKTANLPFVPIGECKKLTPDSFTESLTSDKICAGYTNGTAALCKGDSGGGLAFPEVFRNVTRYYLRGIASTAPPPASWNTTCNTKTIITFTSIFKHRDFIKKFV